MNTLLSTGPGNTYLGGTGPGAHFGADCSGDIRTGASEDRDTKASDRTHVEALCRLPDYAELGISGIHLRRTCWRRVRICGSYKSCWDIPVRRQRKFTHMSANGHWGGLSVH